MVTVAAANGWPERDETHRVGNFDRLGATRRVKQNHGAVNEHFAKPPRTPVRREQTEVGSRGPEKSCKRQEERLHGSTGLPACATSAEIRWFHLRFMTLRFPLLFRSVSLLSGRVSHPAHPQHEDIPWLYLHVTAAQSFARSKIHEFAAFHRRSLRRGGVIEQECNPLLA
jgi:hypothetical protein